MSENMMNSSHKMTNTASRTGHDRTFRKPKKFICKRCLVAKDFDTWSQVKKHFKDTHHHTLVNGQKKSFINPKAL